MLQRVPGGVLATLDQAGAAVDLLLSPQARKDEGELNTYTARDPRGIGIKGAYPQVNRGHNDRAILGLVRDAYAKSASARVLVNRLVGDTWAKWITLEAGEALKERLEQVFRNPTETPGERPLWWWLEQADRRAVRDGRSLLYFNLADATGDPGQPPTRVRGIRGVQIVGADRIAGKTYDENPASPTFGQVKSWTIMLNMGAGEARGLVSASVEIHAERVLPFIPSPSEDDPLDGVSELWSLINYVEMDENFLWAVAEAYYQEARPLVYARRDPNVQGAFNDAAKKTVKESLEKLEDPLTQRVVFNGIIVEKLSPANGPANPQPAGEILFDHLAMALGVPKSILRGDAAGELAAAKENMRQYAGRVGTRREQYAGPVLYGLLDRLIRWDVQSWLRRPPSPVEFTWNPLVEQDELEHADIQLKTMVTRTGYRRARLPMPQEVAYEEVAEWPEGTEELPEPQPFGAGAMTPGAAAGEDARRTRARRDTRDFYDGPEGSHQVAHRFENRLEAVLTRAKRELRQFLAKQGGEGRKDALDDEAARFVIDLRVREEFARIIQDALEEAAYEGASGAFSELGEERVFEFIDDTRIRRFRTVGRELGTSMQERLAEYVRRELAEGVAEGEDTRALTKRLEHAFVLGRVDAQRIARTETVRGFNVGTVEALRALGVTRLEFVAFPDADGGNPTGPCQQRAGTIFEVGTLLEADRPPIHPNCIMPGQEVQGAVTGALKARYAGPAVELVTSSGQRLAVTPNHPVLTSKGFVPASELRKGDHLLRYSGRAPAPVQANHEQHPTAVEHVFEMLALLGARQRVPLAAEDLHGDARRVLDGQVDVVGAEGPLRVSLDAVAEELCAEPLLAFADAKASGLAGAGALREAFGRVALASAGSPRGPQLSPDQAGAGLHAQPLLPLRLGPASQLDARALEALPERGPGDAGFVRKLLEAGAGAVSLDELVEVRDVHFDGHVYDLQTTGGWYVASGLVVHNCRCQLVAAGDGRRDVALYGHTMGGLVEWRLRRARTGWAS